MSATCLLAGLASTASLATAQQAPADKDTASRIALVAEAGTAGFGPSLIITANEKFTFTLGYTWLDYDYDVETDDADYNGKLNLSNIKALANWHPFSGTFHFSAGLFATDNEVSITARPAPGNVFEVNGVDYPTSQIQSITGTATFEDDIAPYVGIGWAKSPANSGFAFYATLGVLFAGDATARLSATGPAAGTTQFQNNLRAEERDINDDLGVLGAYPVLQFGLQYRF
jgi:hypothetical protein